MYKCDKKCIFFACFLGGIMSRIVIFAERRNKVKWMAAKMNEQKKKIVWLTVGLAVMILLLL